MPPLNCAHPLLKKGWNSILFFQKKNDLKRFLKKTKVGNNMKKILLSIITCFIFGLCSQTYAFSRGIYLTQDTEQNSAKLATLIQKAKQYNIDTFVVDINIPSKIYAKNISKILASGIHYVARVVIFPHGGTHAQVTNRSIWAKRLTLAN